jgi:two-component system, LytTR family, response regulator
MDQFEGKIMLSTSNAHHIVSFEDILYCKSENSSTAIFLCNGEKISTSISIGLLESRLVEHSFIRSHQSYIVNMKHILRIHRHKEIELELINDTFLPVSTRRKSVVMQFFNKIERIQRV